MAQTRLCKSSSKTPWPNTRPFCTNCPASKIYKRHDCCCFALRVVGTTTCYGCLRLHKQFHLPKTTTLKSADASRNSYILLQTGALPLDAIARADLPLAMGRLGPLFRPFLVCQSSLRLVCCPPDLAPSHYLHLFILYLLFPSEPSAGTALHVVVWPFFFSSL